MALVVADRVQETTTTTGTGTYTLAGAKDGFQSFAAVGDGNTTYYACTDGTDYEVGIGTYTASGTTLARTTIIESSNSDAAVSWSSGSKDIFVTLPASKAVIEDASNNVAIGNNITVGGTVDGVDIATNIPSSLGTAGQVLTVNSGATAGEWASLPSVSLAEQEFTATSGQTVFTVTGGITDADNVSVYLNGAKLFSTDVTISAAANTVTLASGATTGDLITVTEVAGAASSGGSGGSGVTTYTAKSGTDGTPAGATYIDNASSPSEGDLAYDLAADQLYIRTTSAWKRVSIGVDESPVITTEPATTHTLNSDGSTSTVTMVATDPEGFGITYGIAYPTANNALPDQLATATSINQSTGVYTFDPSTTSSDAGTVKVRLSASDGISTTTRFCTLSLAFSQDITTPNTGIFNAAGTNSYNVTSPITSTSGMGFSSTLRTGKYYFELEVGTASTFSMIGLVDDAVSSAGYNTSGAVILFASNGNKYPSNVSTGLGSWTSSGDTIMFAYDTSTREVWVGKNGSWYQDPSSTSSSFLVGTSSTTAVKLAFGNGASSTETYTGTINVGNNVTYTVPTGFTAH
jgi:hypothetical protein